MLTAQPRRLHGAICIHSYTVPVNERRARGECEWGGILVQGDVKGDMERLYAYCESCPRIEELLKAYLAHASSSSRFLLLTYYTLQLTAVHEHDMYRAFPPAPV